MSARPTRPAPPEPAARGRHRRQRPSAASRTSLRLTVGGAGLAIPLAGAQLAQAAPQDVWNKVAACESSANWSINTGNGYYGGLQFTQSTWEAYGGGAYAARADLASKDQQIAVAEKVLRGQGAGAWPNCGPNSGLSRAAAEPRVQQARADEAVAQASQAKAAKAETEKADAEKAEAARAKAAKAERAKADRSKKQTRYEVVGGDTLSSIAESHRVEDGWQGLYSRNRSTVGGDPDLILPGQELRLAGAKEKAQQGSSDAARKPAEGEARAARQAAAERAAKQAAAEKAEKAKTEKAKAEKAKAEKAEAEREKARKAEAEREKARKAEAAKAKAEKAKAEKAKAEKAKAARAKSSSVIAPVSGVSPTTGYRASGSSWSSGQHTGIDFPVGTGTTVKAVSAGKVVSAGWGDAYGYEVVVRHSDGKYSQYAHLSAISVRAGQSVDTGQRVGRSGATGNVTGPHLHFEVRTGPGYGSDIDPLAYLRGRGVRV